MGKLCRVFNPLL